MKLKYFCAVLCGVAALSLVSCGSTPKSSASADSNTKSNSLNADSTKASAEKAKKEAEIAKKTEKAVANADAAREAAIKAGAEKYYPKLLSDIDKEYESLKKKIAANPGTDYSANIEEIAKKYEALEKASLARKMQEDISKLDFDFTSVDKNAAQTGADALKRFNSLNSNASGDELLSNAEAAYKAYKTLMDKGYKAMAARERSDALKAKKDADSVKAAVAKKTKEQYTQAANKFVKADAAYSRGSTYDAYNGYKEVKESYTELYEIVKQDREAAQAALEKAKQRVAEAATYSAEADTIAPITEKVAGIEDESTTLLEKDNFANPEDAVIDVESNETAKAVEKAAEAAIAEDDAKKK